MPRFEAEIGETTRETEAPVDPHKPAQEFRHVYWVDEAADHDAAREAAYAAWGEKYGPGNQPSSAIVKVTPLDA